MSSQRVKIALEIEKKYYYAADHLDGHKGFEKQRLNESKLGQNADYSTFDKALGSKRALAARKYK